MALLNCHECDGKVSSEAKACPHCGAPARRSPPPEVKKPATKEAYKQAVESTVQEHKAQIAAREPIPPGPWQAELEKHRKLTERYELGEKISEVSKEYLDAVKGKTECVDGVVCPACSAEAAVRITKSNKVGAALIFGFFSIGHLSKQFRCQKCGYTW